MDSLDVFRDLKQVVGKLERLESVSYPGRWYSEEDGLVWELYAENIHEGMEFHPLKIAKCPKKSKEFYEYWPRQEEAELMCYLRNEVGPALKRAVEQLELERRAAGRSR